MIAPMLAKAVGDQVPETPGLLYEPKWDGFRCIVFRDDGVVLQSRKEEDFSYLFPEVVAAAEGLPLGTTLDGELVIVGDKGLEFDLLGNRIRPRSEAGGWKIASLAEATPAQFVAFDILRLGGEDVSQQPFASAPGPPRSPHPAVRHAPHPHHRRPGGGTRMVQPLRRCRARRRRLQTRRRAVHAWEADHAQGQACADRRRRGGGWRPYKNAAPDGSEMVGALLLGSLRRGRQCCTTSAPPDRSPATTASHWPRNSRPIEIGPDDDHPWKWAGDGQRVPGMQSRWTGKKDMGFHPIQPILVAEVKYDHMQGDRFRHVASFVRWRPDREPASCTYEQLDQPVKFDVAAVLAGEVR